MLPLLIVLHILIAIALIGLVLIQRGRGADIGAAFGSGASSTVFGSRGSASFLTRVTGILATLFFISSLGLTYFYGQQTEQRRSVTELAAPAAPVSGSEDAAPAGPADLPQVPAQPFAPEKLPGQSGQQ